MQRDQNVTEKQIDQAVEATFPASDPVSLHSTGAEVVERKPDRVAPRGWWSRVLGRLKGETGRKSPAPKSPSGT